MMFRTRFRPLFWYWFAMPVPSGTVNRSRDGSKAWPTVSHASARSAANRRQFHERTYAEQSEHGPASEIHLDADLKAVLDQELSRLPECHRVVIVLCDLEGLSYDQAAQALGWPMGTVKSRLSRAATDSVPA